MRCREPTSGAGTSLVAAACARRRLHADRRRLHRRRGGGAHIRIPGLTSATVPICLGILRRDHPAQPPRARRSRKSIPAPDPPVHRRPIGDHRHRPDPPARRRRAAARYSHSCRPTRSRWWGYCSCSRRSRPGAARSTGVEAIANGVPLFKEPRQVRAKRTELLLGVILGAMLLGLAVLARRWHIGPRWGQTVLSQIMARRSAGTGPTTWSRSPSPSCWPSPPTPRSVDCPYLTSLLARTTTCPISSPCAATGRSSPTESGCWQACPPVADRGGREHQLVDPALRHRRVHRVHALPDRSGRPLVATPARPVGTTVPASTGSARS